MQKEQLESHELQVTQLKHELKEHQKTPVPSKGLPLQNFKEKEAYLQYEVRAGGQESVTLVNQFVHSLATSLRGLCKHFKRQDVGRTAANGVALSADNTANARGGCRDIPHGLGQHAHNAAKY